MSEQKQADVLQEITPPSQNIHLHDVAVTWAVNYFF